MELIDGPLPIEEWLQQFPDALALWSEREAAYRALTVAKAVYCARPGAREGQDHAHAWQKVEMWDRAVEPILKAYGMYNAAYPRKWRLEPGERILPLGG